MDRCIEIELSPIHIDISAVDDRLDNGGGAHLFDKALGGYAVWQQDSVLTQSQCRHIAELGNALVEYQGVTGDRAGEAVRKSKVSWIFPGQYADWLFIELGKIVQQVNRDMFNFDLYGFTQGMQFTRYKAPGSHYTWHMDMGPGFANRKLSMIVQLSDPNEYEGGEVELFLGETPTAISKQQGSMVIFPSFIMHRVKPVTMGERLSLVSWIEGPALR